MAEVADVHGQQVVVFVVSEMLVANADHEEVHVHHWNYLCFVPSKSTPISSASLRSLIATCPTALL